MRTAAAATTTAATIVTATTAATPATPITTAATTTPTTVAATVMASHTRGTITVQATIATTITGADVVDDDNPFLVPLSFHLCESSPANQPDADTTSEGSAAHPKSCKNAQDVRAFFQQENQQSYCKFCEYVFFFLRYPLF